MSKKRNSLLSSNSLNSSFVFNSKALSKRQVASDQQKDQLDFSQRTSEAVRFAQHHNENILQLLEESEQEKRTQKLEKHSRNDVWSFFARFEQESNPDITISEINLGRKNKSRPQQKNDRKLNGAMKSHPTSESKQKQENHDTENQEQENSRYPKRHRLQPLRYWMGEKCIYKNGKIIDIKKQSE